MAEEKKTKKAGESFWKIGCSDEKNWLTGISGNWDSIRKKGGTLALKKDGGVSCPVLGCQRRFALGQARTKD